MQVEIDNVKQLLLNPAEESNQLGMQLLESIFSPQESLNILMEVLKTRFSEKRLKWNTRTGEQVPEDNAFYIREFHIYSSQNEGSIDIFDCLIDENKLITLDGLFDVEFDMPVLLYRPVLQSKKGLSIDQQLALIKAHLLDILNMSATEKEHKRIIDQHKVQLFGSDPLLVKTGLLELKKHIGWDQAIEFFFENCIYRRFGFTDTDPGTDIGIYNIVDYNQNVGQGSGDGYLVLRSAGNLDQIIYQSEKQNTPYSERIKALQRILPELLS
ncbi:MAG: hypothetical protein MK212_01295 [Saprospiraceae bacterium]|nr:hypothetical protein [Saprospiraceae bacterium]